MKTDFLYLKPGTEKILKNIDTVVFDIDGVLVDVTDSFREMISTATNIYFTLKFKLTDNGRLIKKSETQLFKNAGGFNNDWNLTSACVLFFLSVFLNYKQSIKDTVTLRNHAPSLTRFTDNIEKEGGGIKAAVEVVKKTFSNWEEISGNWDRKMIEQICKELYAGRKIKEIYHTPPKFNISQQGLYKKENILLNEELLSNNLKYSVITGRTSGETELVLSRFKKLPALLGNRIVTDDGNFKKPNPEVFSPAIKTSRTAIYLGDTIDDLISVKNFRKMDKSHKLIFGAISNKETLFKIFKRNGAEIISPNVNEILTLINLRRRNEGKKS